MAVEQVAAPAVPPAPPPLLEAPVPDPPAAGCEPPVPPTRPPALEPLAPSGSLPPVPKSEIPASMLARPTGLPRAPHAATVKLNQTARLRLGMLEA